MLLCSAGENSSDEEERPLKRTKLEEEAARETLLQQAKDVAPNEEVHVLYRLVNFQAWHPSTCKFWSRKTPYNHEVVDHH